MANYSDDSDEELGAYIYRTSHTAQLLKEEAAARSNGLATNHNKSNNITITRSKRKNPHEVENVSVSSEPKERAKKKKRYICSQEGCVNQVRKGGVCIRHGAKVKRKIRTCNTEGCANQVRKGGVCIRHGAKRTKKKYTCSYEGCNNHVVKGGVCIRHGHHGQERLAVMKDVPTLLSMEEFVSGMAQRKR